MALQLKPDIILMDVSMPYLSGVDVTRRLTEQLPGIRVVGLSMHRQEDIASAMMAAGAMAYLTKSMEPEGLVAAVRDCASRPAGASQTDIASYI
jgi:DNA-binding NarL/FixJ family response regulator